MNARPNQDPGDPRTLSAQERAALEGIAGHEQATDPRFAARMASGAAGRPGRPDGPPSAGATGEAAPAGGDGRRHREPLIPSRRRDQVIQAVVVFVVAAAVLPASWTVGLVLVTMLVVVPACLVVHAVRSGELRAGRWLARETPPEDPG